LLASLLSGAGLFALPSLQAAEPLPAAPQGMQEWLERLHEASRRRAYTGTFVVSADGEMAASRIWHICDGKQQLERIETLTGAPRTTVRRNDEVLTLVPDAQLAVRETRAALRLFPDFLRRPGQQIATYYQARPAGHDRVAGHEANLVDFVPRDDWRFGYRVWSEKRTGLVIKLQTRNAQAEVLEQVAFTELQLDVPLQMAYLERQMAPPKGYRVKQPLVRQTTAQAEGWRLKAEVPGFQSVSCQVQVPASAAMPGIMQWVFSDGMASVSLFVETFDPVRHTKEKAVASGATHSLTRRLDSHWVTALGEVPLKTLQAFVEALERHR
jgi:sigma-E factor negative regulatory protein RseB